MNCNISENCYRPQVQSQSSGFSNWNQQYEVVVNLDFVPKTQPDPQETTPPLQTRKKQSNENNQTVTAAPETQIHKGPPLNGQVDGCEEVASKCMDQGLRNKNIYIYIFF